MRLRYLRLRNKAPHTDTRVVFGREELLGLAGSLHFLVGVNGTGKSRLLQVLVETFKHLENNRVPSYAVTLAYDLPHPETKIRRTVLFHCSPTETGLYEYESAVPNTSDDAWTDLEEDGLLLPDNLGANKRLWHRQGSLRDNVLMDVSLDYLLPSAVLVYTSGAIGNWEHLFAPRQDTENLGENLLERATRAMELDFSFEKVAPNTDAGASKVVWVRGEDYRAALLVAVLETAAAEFDTVLRDGSEKFIKERQRFRLIGRAMPERFDESFRSLLDEVDFLFPITASLTFGIDTAPLELKALASSQQLYPPENTTEERLYFDLRSRQPAQEAQPPPENMARRLLRVLTGSQVGDGFTAFEGLKKILQWQHQGYLKTANISMVLKKLDVPDPIPLESLSDGERMFLGRMALLNLIGGMPNALAILDEPETHFNDFWKREMVDIVDRSLETQPTDVLMTTHSSIALTDAFSREINRLFRSKRTPDLIKADHPRDPTFGATPTEVLQEIFDGPRAVGQRAAEFLDTLLVLLLHPEEVLRSWEDNKASQVLKNAVYKELMPAEEAPWEEHEREKARNQLAKKLEQTLRVVFDYGTDKYPISERLVGVIKKNLMPKVGAGYYRFEFARRLMLLEQNAISEEK
jgi:ABC-type transport system involved in cytochrome c biogenesis ATPase subunit